MTMILKRTTAIAAIAALPLAPIAAHAQTQGQQGQSQETQNQQGQTQQGQAAQGDQTQAQQGQDTQAEQGQTNQAGTNQAGGQQQAGADAGPDMVVARVGDQDIMRSDVLKVIGQLPPQLQQQPAEMLIPMAVDQLVLRELILQEARDAGLQEAPEVTALVGDATEEALENAMVTVWLDRELGGSVTDAAVQETYGEIETQLGDQAPALEQIRPQIEQELRRQAFVELSERLQQDADITVFGADGQPITQ